MVSGLTPDSHNVTNPLSGDVSCDRTPGLETARLRSYVARQLSLKRSACGRFWTQPASPAPNVSATSSATWTHRQKPRCGCGFGRRAPEPEAAPPGLLRSFARAFGVPEMLESWDAREPEVASGAFPKRAILFGMLRRDPRRSRRSPRRRTRATVRRRGQEDQLYSKRRK